MTRPQYVTPAQRVAELVAQYGSYRKAAKAIEVDYAYLYKVAGGLQPASPAMLSALGLRKEVNVRYFRIGA